MALEEKDILGARQQLSCAVEESQLQDVLGQVERLELENAKLYQNIEVRQESESKVFSYLNAKVLDSEEQLREVESKFMLEKTQLEATTRDVKKQIQSLENKKNRELKTVEDENRALRDNIALFEKYEKELPLLDIKVAKLEETLKKMHEKHEAEMTV
jgi:uncharacterized protein (UPF0335 family)